MIDTDGTFVLRSSNVSDGEIIDADNVYVESDVVNCRNVKIGDVIVVVRNGSRNLIGKHAQIKNKMRNTVIGAFMTGLRSNQPEFLNVLLNTSQFNIEITKNSGATINQITTGAFKQMMFSIPSENAEQTAIGNLFRTLDDTITLHKRKLDGLKELKKGYLQVMFPQNGETVPRVRFKGFEGEWRERKLGEVAEIVGGGTPSTGIDEYWNGNIDWYAPAEIGEQIFLDGSQRKITELGLKASSARMLPVGTVLFTSRAGIGKSVILVKAGTTNQGFQSVVPHKDELDSYFIFSRTPELKKYGETVGAGSTFVEVSGKQMAQMPILIPQLPEQTAIGTFFRSLDEQIADQAEKLEQLKQLKSAYLQKMFI